MALDDDMIFRNPFEFQVSLVVVNDSVTRETTTLDQQQRHSDMQYEITDTKTNVGTKELPMTQAVYECFRIILENRKKQKVESVIDVYRGFLFQDKNRKPMVALHWEKYFQHAVEKYNSI